MYDIFDDIFDDGYGSNDYGMSDTDVDVELAFEAAMGTGTDYEYDYATEGFRDAMGKIGTKIADTARNMVRKIGEMFKKISKWVTDKLAPLRAKSASGDNKALQQVLKALDRQVSNASGPRKAEVKQKVARIKRAIMQAIDTTKGSVSKINRALSDGVAVFKAAKTIGNSFIEKMNAAVAYGAEKGNTDDGNDLIDKMNSLERRYATLCTAIKEALDPEEDERAMQIIKDEMPGGESRFNEILKAIKFDKVDFRAIFAAEGELKVTCSQGAEACNRLDTKLNDKYSRYEKGANGKYARNDNATIDEKNRFDDDSRQYLSALTVNWSKFTQLEDKLSQMLTDTANVFQAGGGVEVTKGYSDPNSGRTWYAVKPNGADSRLYAAGVRSTGRRFDTEDIPTRHRQEPTDNTLS